MIIVIGIIVIGKKMIDLSNRDNMNFDEYDWYFDKSKAPSDTTTSSSSSNPWAMPTATCVGELCCLSTPGMIYDQVQKVCVLNTNTTLDTTEMATETTTTTTTDTTTGATTESFTNPFIRQKW
jgi:hypothetical protein